MSTQSIRRNNNEVLWATLPKATHRRAKLLAMAEGVPLNVFVSQRLAPMIDNEFKIFLMEETHRTMAAATKEQHAQ